MYVPDHFRMSASDTRQFLREVPAGTLVSHDTSGRLLASYLPWALVGEDCLTTHIGKVNPQAHSAGQALVILMGEDAYVSEEWMNEGEAPGWVYETLHLYGRLIIHTETDWILQSFSDILARFSASSLGDYEPEWLEKQARACVGVEFLIEEWQGKAKLAQNRSEEEVRMIASQIEPNCPHLADRMREVSLPHIAAREERVRQARPYDGMPIMGFQ